MRSPANAAYSLTSRWSATTGWCEQSEADIFVLWPIVCLHTRQDMRRYGLRTY